MISAGVIELAPTQSVGHYIEAAKQQRVWDPGSPLWRPDRDNRHRRDYSLSDERGTDSQATLCGGAPEKSEKGARRHDG